MKQELDLCVCSHISNDILLFIKFLWEINSAGLYSNY